MSKIGILTFEQFQGKKGLGSSRIRGHWLIDVWPEAELFVQGEKYDVVIYQKAYFVEHARAFKGVKIFDVCDPDFLHWGYRTKEMLEEVDAVTTSTEALAETFRKFTDKPVVCIPDRINLQEISRTKVHKGDIKWVAWYGYSSNFDMLRSAVPALKKLGLGLIVISDKGFVLPTGCKDMQLKNFPHNWKTFYHDILEADVVINPQGKKGRWGFKSNNKTILSWALGLPVAENLDDLQKFMSEEKRIEESQQRMEEVKNDWTIDKSITEYKKLISLLTE